MDKSQTELFQELQLAESRQLKLDAVFCLQKEIDQKNVIFLRIGQTESTRALDVVLQDDDTYKILEYHD